MAEIHRALQDVVLCLHTSHFVNGLVGVQEELEVGPELVVAAIVVAPDGCLLERSVHPLDPGSGPGQAGSGHSSRGSVAW